MYLITNIAAGVGVLVFLLIALALEEFTFKKISVRHLTVMATFAAVSVVLTNFISYSIPIMGNIRLAFGDWIIFLIGMMFGPLSGVISAISIDTLGNIAPNAFGYHAGYMFNKVVLGFFGALVFLSNSQNRLWLKVIVFYSIPYVFQSLVLNQIWMMSWIGKAAWLDLIPKIIKLPIALPIYITITYSSFKVIYQMLKRWPEENVWCLNRITKNQRQHQLPSF